MIARSLFVALMPPILTALAACGGGGSGSTTDPNPTIPQLPPTASITSFSISHDTVDLRDSVTFEWRTDPPDTGSPDFTLALTGHGEVAGRSPLTIDDIRFGGTYTLRMTRGNGTFDAREASLTIRPESVPQGFVGVLNDNLLVWHGWKLDHRHRPGARQDYVRLLYEHGIIQDVFDWIVFIDGVENTEHYAYSASFARLNDQGARGFTDGGLTSGQAAAVLRTDRLRGSAHVATNRYTAYSLVHEIMHQWANNIRALGVGVPLGVLGRAWPAPWLRWRHPARVRCLAGPPRRERLQRCRRRARATTCPTALSKCTSPAGGRSPDVPPIKVAHNADWTRDANDDIVTRNEMNYTEYVFHAPEGFTSYDRDWLIDTLGPREPPLGEAPTDFRLLFVYMVDDEFPALDRAA